MVERKQEIIIPGAPIPLQRHRSYGKKMVDPQKQEKEAFRLQVISQTGPVTPYEGPIWLYLVFEMPIPSSLSKKRAEALEGELHYKRPDIDNLVKFVLDAINGVIWKDDAQVTELYAQKRYSHNPETCIEWDFF